jgi:hypothetical protein
MTGWFGLVGLAASLGPYSHLLLFLLLRCGKLNRESLRGGESGIYP